MCSLIRRNDFLKTFDAKFKVFLLLDRATISLFSAMQEVKTLNNADFSLKLQTLGLKRRQLITALDNICSIPGRRTGEPVFMALLNASTVEFSGWINISSKHN